MSPSLLGVSIAQKKDHTVYYIASLTYRRKHISLGSFSSEQTAHNAYLEAKSILFDYETVLKDFHSDAVLSFNKWVSLLNFRDNGIYFATPIYTKKYYFLYYLSPSVELIFDIDDLFYYSSHKILQRGKHLFVADYGMQVTLLGRYGIRSYSVLNRDYRFRNGNTHDYRYENIEIINRYHGVRRVIKNNSVQYQVTIHIRSNYRVGYYSTEEKAAVAYNKAVDILHKQGFRKNYMQNYVESLSNQEYADLYTRIKVSPKLSLLNPNIIKT